MKYYLYIVFSIFNVDGLAGESSLRGHQIVLDVFYCRHALWADYNTPFEHLHAESA